MATTNRLTAKTVAHPQGFLASNVLFRKTGPTTLEWPVELASITQDSYPA